MKQRKGFSLFWTIIIIIITAIVSGLTTGIIVYNSYKNNAGISYTALSKDKALVDFIEVYSSIIDDYYESVDKEKMLDEAISAMMNYLGDSYTSYLTEEETEQLAEKLAGEYRGIGITIAGNIITDVQEDSPASKAGLVINDQIIKINDIDVKEKTAKEISDLIKGDKKLKRVSVAVLRGEEEKNFNIDISTLYVPAISSEVINENNKKIGYIYIGTFSNTLGAQVKRQLEKFKEEKVEGIIIDVRDNTGGYLNAATDVANLFLEKGRIIYSLEDKKGRIDTVDETDASQNYPMVVLINENSASASEILAGALKDSYGATLVGKTSFGKGKVQQTKTLQDGSMVKYTSAKWLTPSGECIDEKGLNPDIEVENLYEYEDEAKTMIKSITDFQLPKAIEVLSK